MLFAHNGGGLRLAAVVILCAGLLACSTETPSNNPSAPATQQPQAADLRTHLDLLMAEQVMIVAKETSAAANHSDSYAGYTALLSTNAADLSALMGRAFGNTTGAQFMDEWSAQNGYLVDYAIGVVTHNDGKAKDAMTGLTTTFVPQFAQLVSDTSRLPLDPVTQLTTQQVLEDKVFIDDLAALKYSAFYQDLHTAYAQTFRLGDALAQQIAQRFADKFPGDPATPVVDMRVSINQLMQEHSYLVTMATDAAVAGRAPEKAAANDALAANADMLGTAFAKALGNSSATQFDTVWKARNNALLAYASGDAASGQGLAGSFPGVFASLAHVSKSHVMSQLSATIKVIDDQRTKASTTVAGDDRAAASAMQPIADSIQG